MSKRSPARPVTLTDAANTLFGARIGDRVRLREGHPWAGYTGRVTGSGLVGGSLALAVEVDDGGPTTVLYRSEIEVINDE